MQFISCSQPHDVISGQEKKRKYALRLLQCNYVKLELLKMTDFIVKKIVCKSLIIPQQVHSYVIDNHDSSLVRIVNVFSYVDEIE